MQDRDMDAKAVSHFLLFLFFFQALSATTSTALNISNVLGKYPDYGALNDLFHKTKITADINKRQTITILALDNDTIRSITDRDPDVLRRILMNHVVLDYFDEIKIKKLGRRTTHLTTLYQTTGLATDNNGFVNLTKISPGNTVFGSGVEGSPLVARLLGTVVSMPFNISVLHISTPIIAPNFGDAVLPPPPPPSTSPPAPAPKKSPPPAEVPAPDEAASPEAPTPAPSDSPSPAPARAPKHSRAADAPDDGMAPDDEPVADSASRLDLSIAIAAVVSLVTCLAAF